MLSSLHLHMDTFRAIEGSRANQNYLATLKYAINNHLIKKSSFGIASSTPWQKVNSLAFLVL